MADILIPEGHTLPWPELRKALKRLIKAVAPNARVYSRWPLRYNVGDTVNLLKSKADGGKIHSWMVSVVEARPEERKAGGYEIEWNLTLRVWGFIGYESGTSDENTQDTIEEEARKIAAVLYLNHKNLAMDNSQGLRDVGLLTFEDLDVQGFADGVDCHVVQGTITIKTSEHFTLAA